MELYDKFNKDKFIKFVYLSKLIWDVSDVYKIVSYYKDKYNKNVYDGIYSKTITIKINKKINKLLVDGKNIKSNKEGVYIYKTRFPFNINIIAIRKWCIPYIKKYIGMVPDTINIKLWECIAYKKFNITSKTYYINTNWYKISLNWIKASKLYISTLTNSVAKENWYLDLPVFNKNNTKILAQWFDSYWMPIIKVYDNKWKLINRCLYIYINPDSDLKNKIDKVKSKLQVNRYYYATYWEKLWLPWWWDLNFKTWNWKEWQMQLYDNINDVLLVKYCYKF